MVSTMRFTNWYKNTYIVCKNQKPLIWAVFFMTKLVTKVKNISNFTNRLLVCVKYTEVIFKTKIFISWIRYF